MIALASRLAAGLALDAALALSASPASARAAGTAHDTWNPAHIDQLPAPIRDRVRAACAAPRAQHDFARYRDGGRVVVLDFAYFRCGTVAPVAADGDLTQVLVWTGSRYVRATDRHAPRL